MRPIAVFRFSPTEGPAYFAEWLDAHGFAWQLVALDAGATVPSDPRAFAGIGMMGGPMSVNDALAWTAPLARAACATPSMRACRCSGIASADRCSRRRSARR
jgi:GMP synthase-like glutamine amidotransferase